LLVRSSKRVRNNRDRSELREVIRLEIIVNQDNEHSSEESCFHDWNYFQYGYRISIKYGVVNSVITI
jgi:hypothetical protein